MTLGGAFVTYFFTITVEIHARSLVNFYGQYADRQKNLKFMRRVSERDNLVPRVLSLLSRGRERTLKTRLRARAGNSTICYRKKQIDVRF